MAKNNNRRAEQKRSTVCFNAAVKLWHQRKEQKELQMDAMDLYISVYWEDNLVFYGCLTIPGIMSSF